MPAPFPSLAWPEAIAFYLVWTGFATAAVQTRFKAQWHPGTRISVGVERAASWLLLLLLAAPTLVVILWSNLQSPPPPIIPRMAFLIPQIVISASAAAVLTRKERRAARDFHPVNLRRAYFSQILGAIAFPLIAMTMLVPRAAHTPAMARFSFVVFVLATCIATVFLSEPPGDQPGSDFPLEDTPLRSEILTLGSRFGLELENLGVLPEPKSRATYRTPLLRSPRNSRRSNGTAKGRAIPLANLLQLDPDAVTASLSHLWAKNSAPDSLPVRIKRGPRVLFILFSFFFPLSVLTATFLPVIALLSVSRIVTPLELAAMLGLGFVVILAGYRIVGRLMGQCRTAIEAHRDAFRIWREAETWTERSPEDYFVALARRHAFFHAIFDPEIALHQIRRDRALMRFLDEQPPGTREHALQAARHALEGDLRLFGVDHAPENPTIAAQ